MAKSMSESQRRKRSDKGAGCLWPGVGVILAIFSIFVIVLIAALNRANRAKVQPPIEITVVAYQTGTATPRQNEESTVETQSPLLTPNPGEVVFYSIGELVEIFGTEGDGLRLRNAPGLGATINVLALENEVYEVRGGPEEMDGYVWWFLINPYDNEIQGWSVGTFLRGINR